MSGGEVVFLAKVRVAQTVLLVDRVFVPCQKGAVHKNGEHDEFAFYPLKTRASAIVNKFFCEQTGVS